ADVHLINPWSFWMLSDLAFHAQGTFLSTVRGRREQFVRHVTGGDHTLHDAGTIPQLQEMDSFAAAPVVQPPEQYDATSDVVFQLFNRDFRYFTVDHVVMVVSTTNGERKNRRRCGGSSADFEVN